MVGTIELVAFDDIVGTKLEVSFEIVGINEVVTLTIVGAVVDVILAMVGVNDDETGGRLEGPAEVKA